MKSGPLPESPVLLTHLFSSLCGFLIIIIVIITNIYTVSREHLTVVYSSSHRIKEAY